MKRQLQLVLGLSCVLLPTQVPEASPPTSTDFFAADEEMLRGEYLTSFLALAGEKPLTAAGPVASIEPTRAEIYRFTYAASGFPVRFFRIERHGSRYQLSAGAVSLDEWNKPGRVLGRINKAVSEADWVHFTSLLEDSFWQLDHTHIRRERLCLENLPPGESRGDCPLTVQTDGEDWVLEGVDSKQYHVVLGEGEPGLVRSAGEFLMSLVIEELWAPDLR